MKYISLSQMIFMCAGLSAVSNGRKHPKLQLGRYMKENGLPKYFNFQRLLTKPNPFLPVTPVSPQPCPRCRSPRLTRSRDPTLVVASDLRAIMVPCAATGDSRATTNPSTPSPGPLPVPGWRWRLGGGEGRCAALEMEIGGSAVAGGDE